MEGTQFSIIQINKTKTVLQLNPNSRRFLSLEMLFLETFKKDSTLETTISKIQSYEISIFRNPNFKEFPF